MARLKERIAFVYLREGGMRQSVVRCILIYEILVNVEVKFRTGFP